MSPNKNPRYDLSLPFDPTSLVPIKDLPPALPTITGTAAFAVTLSLSTLLQSRLFKISTGTTAPIPSILGLGTVAIASIVSHVISIQTYQKMTYNKNDIFNNLNWKPSSSNFDFDFDLPSIEMPNFGASNYFIDDIKKIQNNMNLDHTMRVIVLGLIAYKGIGGRFWSISPSSFTNLGSFAKHSVSLPATDAYATQSQRKIIERMGKLAGCHTCGDHMITSRGFNGVKFIADHMPPQSVVKQMNSRWYRKIFGIKVKQRFFPQCLKCSRIQGSILGNAVQKASSSRLMKSKIHNLAKSGGGKNAYNHGLKLRREYLAGGIISAATVWSANERDIGRDSQRRFKKWQYQIEEKVMNSIYFLKKYINVN